MAPSDENRLAREALRPVFRDLFASALPQTEADFGAEAGQMLRLNLNEAARGPSLKVEEALKEAARGLNRYPDPKGRALKCALAAMTGADADLIVLGNGSDELIQFAITIACGPGDPLVLPTPSFGRYAAAARLMEAEAIPVPVLQDGVCDLAGMLLQAEMRRAAMVVATPNNPTGGMFGAEELDLLAKRAPRDRLLIVDEAYFEFAQADGGANALEFLRRRQGPWLLLRTLSKAYGIAGLRLGYAVASEQAIVNALDHVRGAFNVNVLTQAGALAALADPAAMRDIVQSTVRERERLRERLAALGFAVLPSAANFLAVALPMPAVVAVGKLAGRNCLVGLVGPAPFDRHIRVTIGTAEENDRFVAELLQICAE